MSLATLEKRSLQSGGFGPPVFHPFYPSQTLRASGRAATLSRSARRLTRTSLLVADAIFQSALSELDPHDRARRIKWLCENACALHGVKVRVQGSLPEGPAALVANHISYLDPLAIAAERGLTAIAKEDVLAWPILGRALGELGLLFVNRGDHYSGARVLREAMRLFERGLPVLTFPEGTTTRGDRILPFKRGIFGAAILARVPIVPITIRYADGEAAWVDDDPFLPHYLRLTQKEITEIELIVGEAIMPQPDDRAEALAQLAEATVRETLRRANHEPLCSPKIEKEIAK